RWEHGIMIYGVLGIYSIIKLIIANVFWSKQFKQEMKATLIYTSIGVLFVLYYVFG
ncbi:hypothetical protein GOV09_04705, partial [Candidatus Woesearchaeota archaeon]|nr:hypothetical protein [Candidatus Woesearchaeota archaeon]